MSKIAKNKTKLKQKIELLEAESEVLKQELEKELIVTKTKVSDSVKMALGIFGGLVFSAIVLGGISGRKKKQNSDQKEYKSKKVYQRFRDQLVHELTGQATDFLLGVVKDKLSNYVENSETTRDEDSEITD